jgi:hypothetical protein
MLRLHLLSPFALFALPFAVEPLNAQEKKPNPPAPAGRIEIVIGDDDPKKAPADEKELRKFIQKQIVIDGAVLQILGQGQPNPWVAGDKKPNDAVQRLERALKQLQGPADQLDLREVRKEIAEALKQLKGAGNPPAVIDRSRSVTPRIDNLVPKQGPGSGWGGPGSAPWMPGMPGGPGRGVWTPDGKKQSPEDLKKQLQKLLEQQKAGPELESKKQEKEAIRQLDVAQKALQYVLRSQRLDVADWQVAKARPTLGVSVEPPPAVLAEQLSLPRGQGLVITQVVPDSPAAKAGLHVNDVLVKLDGKAVPAQQEALVKMVGELKGTITAIVIRHGKETTIQKLQLASPEPVQPPPQLIINRLQEKEKDRKDLVAHWKIVDPATGKAGGDGTTTITRTADRFVAVFAAAKERVIVTGTLKGGNAAVDTILIETAGQHQTYANVETVPAGLRPSVTRLLDLARR